MIKLEPGKDKHFVAVYGPLEKGKVSNWILAVDPNAKFITGGFVGGRMFSLGSFPYIIAPKNSDDLVYCEVYEVNDAAFNAVAAWYGPHFKEYIGQITSADMKVEASVWFVDKCIGGVKITGGAWK